MIAPGTILGEKFRVERILGQGGMGLVVEATNLTLAQRVAIKLLLPEYLGVQTIVERFVREARAVARLRGEHVCRVSDVGSLPNGAPYMVMELLHGADLATVRQARVMLDIPTAVDYVLQAMTGVAEAHAAGMVHRDLKPSNLFVTSRPDGTEIVKVLDFGIVKSQEETSHSLTTTAAVMGSPSYMSPEQMRSSRNVDQRTDIWALGVILYELVSGRLPFNSPTVTELAIIIATEPTPSLGASVSPGFDAVVRTCLSKNPDDRYPSIAALAQALAPFGGPGARALASGISQIRSTTEPNVRPHRPPESTTLASAASSMSTNSAIASSRGRGRIALIGLGLAVAAGVTIAVFALGGNSVEKSAPPAAAGSASVVEPAATPPAVDAAVVVAPPPVDAPPPPVDAAVAVEPPDEDPEPKTTKRPTPKKPRRDPKSEDPDLGGSRK